MGGWSADETKEMKNDKVRRWRKDRREEQRQPRNETRTHRE